MRVLKLSLHLFFCILYIEANAVLLSVPVLL